MSDEVSQAVGAGQMPPGTGAMAERVALVTGASSGLGSHFAQVLADQGAKVLLGARRLDALERVCDAISSRGGQAAAVALDVTDDASVRAAFDAADRLFGPVDSVIANAGINVPGNAVDIGSDEVEQLFSVNIRGTFLTAREGARRMMRAGSPDRQHGRIVVISSIMGHVAKSGMAAYCASKAATQHLTRALGREWARQGICINALAPGYISTELNSGWFDTPSGQRLIASWPRSRLLEAADLDAMLVYLASDAASRVTGAIFTIDDGQSL